MFASAPASSRATFFAREARERGSWRHFAPQPAGRKLGDDHFVDGAAAPGYSTSAERASTARSPNEVDLGRALPASSMTRAQTLLASLAEETDAAPPADDVDAHAEAAVVGTAEATAASTAPLLNHEEAQDLAEEDEPSLSQ